MRAELQLARQQLEQARQEADRLAKRLGASEEEGKSLRQQMERMANSTAAPVVDNNVIEKHQQELASANSEKQKLKQELASVQTQLKNAGGGPNGGRPPRGRMMLAVGGLVLASMSALGGFKYGQIDPDKSHREKQQTLMSQIATEQSKVQNLESQLNSAVQNVNQLTTQVNARTLEAQDATVKLTRSQHDLSTSQASLTQRTISESQLKQELQTARQNINQLNQDLTNRTAQVQNLQQVVRRHPTWSSFLSYAGPFAGDISWEGERTKDKEKPFDIVFEHGQNGGQVTTDSNTKTKSVSGDLPRVPVLVTSQEKGACVSVPPDATNGWGRMTIHIESKNSKAHIHWSAQP